MNKKTHEVELSGQRVFELGREYAETESKASGLDVHVEYLVEGDIVDCYVEMKDGKAHTLSPIIPSVLEEIEIAKENRQKCAFWCTTCALIFLFGLLKKLRYWRRGSLLKKRLSETDRVQLAGLREQVFLLEKEYSTRGNEMTREEFESRGEELYKEIERIENKYVRPIGKAIRKG